MRGSSGPPKRGGVIVEMPAGVFSVYATNLVASRNVNVAGLDTAEGGLKEPPAGMRVVSLTIDCEPRPMPGRTPAHQHAHVSDEGAGRFLEPDNARTAPFRTTTSAATFMRRPRPRAGRHTMPFLKPYEPQTYAMCRIVAGFLMLWHGSQKVLGWPSGMPDMEMPWHITYVAGPIELLGGLCVCIGLLVRPAAFLLSGTMAFAYWMAHGTQALLPLHNGGELAALYCFLFLFIAARGPGLWSLQSED